MKNSLKLLKSLVILLCLLASLSVKANDDFENLRQLVYQWNELHNSREVEKFDDLYGGQVLFYGKYKSGGYCAGIKAKNLHGDFSQKIVSPISIQLFSSGTAKCSFIKKVTSRQKVKTHQSYLLVKEENGSLRIIGESDLQTDENLNVRLDLGTEMPVTDSGKFNPALLILTSILIIVLIAFFLYRRRNSNLHIVDESNYQSPGNAGNDLLTAKESLRVSTNNVQNKSVQKVIPVQPVTSSVDVIQSSKEKGDAFENYVVNLLSEKSGRFQLLDWRSDKMSSMGRYPLSSHLPDLLIGFHDGSTLHKFAIECKWRKDFQDNSIEWASKRQIENYLAYQKEQNLPVFVAIGVGGLSDDPEKLYLTTLNSIAGASSVSKSKLSAYKRNPQHKFFYNTQQKKL